MIPIRPFSTYELYVRGEYRDTRDNTHDFTGMYTDLLDAGEKQEDIEVMECTPWGTAEYWDMSSAGVWYRR